MSVLRRTSEARRTPGRVVMEQGLPGNAETSPRPKRCDTKGKTGLILEQRCGISTKTCLHRLRCANPSVQERFSIPTDSAWSELRAGAAALHHSSPIHFVFPQSVSRACRYEGGGAIVLLGLAFLLGVQSNEPFNPKSANSAHN